MSEVMDVNAIMNVEKPHYDNGQYLFSVKKAESIMSKNNRPGVSLQLRIEDTAVLKGDRAPLGEVMFKTFYFPMKDDKQTSADYMAMMVQEFILASDVQSHPDYSTVSAGGIATQEFWDLTVGANIEARVQWKEKTEKATDDNGKTTYVGTGDNEQVIDKFKKA
jgi:hypothetical protein